MAGFNSGSFYNPQGNFDFSSLVPNNTATLGMGADLGSGITAPAMSTSPLSANMNQFSQLGAQNTGLGFNLPTAQLGLSALGSLGSLWGAFNASNLAQKQFDYTKGVTDTNLNNSIKSYNTALEDRARARASVTGQSSTDTQAYIDKNSLSR
jgi:hypothetical protein